MISVAYNISVFLYSISTDLLTNNNKTVSELNLQIALKILQDLLT